MNSIGKISYFLCSFFLKIILSGHRSHFKKLDQSTARQIKEKDSRFSKFNCHDVISQKVVVIFKISWTPSSHCAMRTMYEREINTANDPSGKPVSTG
jgi:hypothetical protein